MFAMFTTPEEPPATGQSRRRAAATGDRGPVDGRVSWLWKKPSLAFFHEGEQQKSRGFSALAAAASSGG